MRIISKGPLRITRKVIEEVWRLRQRGVRIIVRDTERRGLALIVNPTGMRWEYSWRPRGVNPATGRRWPNRSMTLGTPESLSPEEARAEAGRLRGEILRGHDPLAERRAREREAAARALEATFTFGKLIEGWVEARRGDRRPSYLAEAASSLRRNFKAWLDRPASSITTAQAVLELDRIRKEVGATTANRCLAYARAAYGWAEKRQMVPANPFRGLDRPSPERSRDRVLTLEEVGAIWRAAAELSSTYRDFVRLLLLTLQRRDEVAGMRWSEISSDLRLWTLPAQRTKNGRAHLVHLAEPAREILADRPRQPDCPFVFPGARGRPITALSRAKRRLDAALAARGTPLEPWTLHDFRRAGVTWLAGAGFPPHVCDRLLNHVTGTIKGVAAVYQRQEFLNERARALDVWAHAVLAAAEGTVIEENVVKWRG